MSNSDIIRHLPALRIIQYSLCHFLFIGLFNIVYVIKERGNDMNKLSAAAFALIAALALYIFNAPASLAASGTAAAGIIDLNNPDSENVEVRKLSYNEMIQVISEKEGLSERAVRSLYPNEQNTLTNKIGIQAATNATSLHEINIRQSVTSAYKPAVQVYVWVTGSGSFYQYDSIYDADLDRKHISSNVSKQFQGKLRVELHSKTRLFYLINGDFYNNGTTTVSGTVSAGGVIWSGSGTVSNSSNHFKYWNNSGYKDIY